MAFAPASSRCSRWSADSARYCAASAAPCWFDNCSAWRRTRRPWCAAALNSALDLVGREGDGVAKGVDAGRDALLGGRGDQLVDDLADIMGAAVASGRRAARGARAGSGRSAPLRPRRAALASLSSRSSPCGIEAVAGLDLDRRAAARASARGGGGGFGRAARRRTRPRSARRSRRCRRRPWRSPHSSRRRGASHARRRGCRRRRDGCGSRSGPA